MSKQTGTRVRGRWAFALAGFASAAVLFAVAQFMAAFFANSSAPLVAMGAVFIDLTPSWLKDFAIATFGTNDKLALFISMGVVAAIGSLLIGLLARRHFALATGAIVVIAWAIGGAVLSRPDTGLVDLTPTILGAVAGLVTLKLLVASAAKAWHLDPEQAPAQGASRRNFMVGTAVAVVGAAVAAGVGKSLSTVRNAADTARSALGLPSAKVLADAPPAGAQVDLSGMPKFITPNKDFYRIDTALSVPRIDPSEWSLRVHGMVEEEFTITFDELLALDLVETYLTLTCVSNPVGGQLVGNAKWLGYPLRQLLERAVPKQGADMVLSTSSDGFSASTPLEVLTDDRMALLAVGMNEEPLPLEHGFPVRMVVPGLYGYVSATKWVVDLEVTRFEDKMGYWTTRGWSDHGPIKLSSRVDVPRSFASVPAGKVTLGGTAWAQTKGISKVQVQIDDEDWKDAELATEASVDTWRQWRYDWKGGSPGNHTVTVRAVDGEGNVQTSDKADPVPDGASGWQRVQFSVE